MIIDNASNLQQMGKDLASLVSQIQVIVNEILDQIDNDSTIEAASYNEALQKISAHVQDLNQVLHQRNS